MPSMQHARSSHLRSSSASETDLRIPLPKLPFLNSSSLTRNETNHHIHSSLISLHLIPLHLTPQYFIFSSNYETTLLFFLSFPFPLHCFFVQNDLIGASFEFDHNPLTFFKIPLSCHLGWQQPHQLQHQHHNHRQGLNFHCI